MATRRKRNRRRKTKRGGYRQYLSNVGFGTGHQPSFDPSMSSPSAIRMVSNWNS
jgi:hypothetical protein